MSCPKISLVWVSIAALLASGCGPGGADDEAPAMLVVEPEFLDFADDEDSEALLVKNSGGRELAFSIEASAGSGGVDWLEIEPASGVVEGGGATTALVRVVNRQQLVPEQYEGKLTVTSPNQDAAVVSVKMTVGQPILMVDPADESDFGKTSNSANLLVKNTGAGELVYSIKLPGSWVTTEAVLQKAIKVNEPQTVVLMLDRTAVPWYGPGNAEMIITSNGLDDDTSSSTARIDLKVEIDASCSVDADCLRGGYYCDSATGECRAVRANGVPCTSNGECSSGSCTDEYCCNEACEGQCQGCNVQDYEGICTPRTDGSTCADGVACTDGDVCDGGACVPGDPVDCSILDTPCALGYCDDVDGTCKVQAPEDTCTIDNECYAGGNGHPDEPCLACRPNMSTNAWSLADNWCQVDGECLAEGTWHANVKCLRCLPATAQESWSVADGFCYIEEECYAFTEPVGSECHACNPASPFEPSPAPDGSACSDDGNPCTLDSCESGACDHAKLSGTNCSDGNDCTKDDVCDDGLCGGTPYACDDGLDCTEDICLGDGSCGADVSPGVCLIYETCFAADALEPDSGGCALCKPAESAQSWTFVQEGIGCSDEDLCTTLDHCSAGVCLGTQVDCDDGLSCTADSCTPDDGECLHQLEAKWCLIDSACYPASTSPSGKNAQCKVCDPAGKTDGWTHIANGTTCDDLSQCSQASECQEGTCVEVGPLCDDGNSCTEGICDQDKGTCSYPAVEDGEPCSGDEDSCTQDVCQSGQCVHPLEPDVCVIDGSCFATDAMDPEVPCRTCLPGSSQADWSPALDSTSCALPSAFGECSSGECLFAACHPGFGNCNELDEDGCEAEYATDSENCGACDKSCLLPNTSASCVNGECGGPTCLSGWADCDEIEQTGCEKPVNGDPENCGECGKVCLTEDPLVVGICLGGECIEAACPPQKYDNDGHPGNACESACAQADEEVCNGFDDDCDGQIDEDFDLLNDLANCGECNNKCEDESVDVWKCLEGECVVELCALGYLNFNKKNDDACEVGPKGHIWVDGILGGGPDADGSEDKPYATIQEGVDTASVGFMVHVKQGIYTGGVTIAKSNVTVAGDSKDTVLVETGNYGTGFQVKASGVTVARMSATGGRYGVRFLGQANSKLVGGRARELDISSLVAPKSSQLNVAEDAVGILVEDANGIEIVDVSVVGVKAGGGKYYGSMGGPGGIGTGVYVKNSIGTKISGCSLSQLTGGYGGYGGDNNAAHAGAVGAGIYLESVEGAVLVGNTIDGATGGKGGDSQKVPGTGGVGTGLYLGGATAGCQVSGNTITSVAGGQAGVAKTDNGQTGINQRGFGIYLEPDALANLVAQNNTLEGEPIYYLYDAAGVVIDGAILMLEANPTNLGKITVVDSTDVKITDSTIAGQSGESGDAGDPGKDGGKPAWGVNLMNCTGCEVSDNIILNLTGGTAGPAERYELAGSGGAAGAIRLAGSQFCTVSGNDISSAYGGTGGQGGFSGRAGEGALSVGIMLENSVGNTISDNVMEGLSGGAGGQNYGDADPAPDQEAYGIHFDDASYDNEIDLTNTLEEVPVVYLYGADGTAVNGLDLAGDANTTNLGKIVVVESSSVTVIGNTVANHHGETGCTDGESNKACNYGLGTGIRIMGCSNCAVAANSVSDIHGGAARARGENFSTGWPGGTGVGIYATDSTGVTANDNKVSTVRGGTGGLGGPQGKPGNGGYGYGIMLLDSSEGMLQDNSALDIAGGASAGSGNARGGAAIAYRLSQSPMTTVLNNVAAEVDGGAGKPDDLPMASCLWVVDSSMITVGHLTCYAVGLTKARGYGVNVYKGQKTVVTVSNSIFSGMSRNCAWSDSANGAGKLVLEHSNLHECGEAQAHNADIDDSCVEKDPLFVSTLLPDLHLKTTSLCIDAGDPESDYAQEPNPNGCRVNMGAYGNTDEAVSAAGTQHCE